MSYAECKHGRLVWVYSTGNHIVGPSFATHCEKCGADPSRGPRVFYRDAGIADADRLDEIDRESTALSLANMRKHAS